MTFSGQTPLSNFKFQNQHIETLHSLWIESIEELIAIEAALQNDNEVVQTSGIKSWINTSEALQKIDPSSLSRLRTPCTGRSLGCLFEDIAIHAYTSSQDIQESRKTPFGLNNESLPASYRLIDKLPEVRDQGNRGTCVAFASVALREFLIECKARLSEQFLFWACKQLDGSLEDGTYISKAMSALAQYGVCKSSIWAYNPNPTDDVSQGPPPPGAIENAKSYILASVRTVEPIVYHIKNILYGGNNSIGMPVVIGILVFNSWYKSAETHRTGKITLPLPTEKPCGGHACCIVGYVDDQSVPGGGYFIVRNSWGTQWAHESPEVPGHAMVPYRYIEKYCLEAFTGPPLKKFVHDWDGFGELASYIRLLDHDARDIEGKLLKQGTRVLFNPKQYELIKEDNESNRRTFIHQDFTWAAELRQSLWFPSLDSLSEELQQKAEKYRIARISFIEGVEENLKDSIQHSFLPAVRPFSLLSTLLAWGQKIKYVQEKANLTDNLLKLLIPKSGVPHEVSIPLEWETWLREFVEFKIFEVGGSIFKFHVAVMIAPSFQFQIPGIIEFKSPGTEIIDSAMGLYDEWSKEENAHVPYVFYSLGSLLPWMQGNHARLAARHCTVLSWFYQEESWFTEIPSTINYPGSVESFLEHLKPETSAMQCKRIKEYIDEKLNSGFEGYLDIVMIARETGYSIHNIKKFLRIIAERDKNYRLFRTPKGKMAISKRESLLGNEIRLPTAYNVLLPRIALLSPALTVLIRSIIIYYLHGTIDFESLIISLLVAYIGEWINTRLMWKRYDGE